MQIEDMGQAYHFLLKHRLVETKPVNRRARNGEESVAEILRYAAVDELQRFNDFLKPQGLLLVEFGDEMRSVAKGGKVWVLARHPESMPPQFFTLEPVIAAMRLRDTDSREITVLWFLHIWLIYLSLIYTRHGRGISEVSGFVDATFAQDVLTQAVKDHIEHVRSQGIEESVKSRAVAILDSEKGRDVERRVGAFLRLMCQSGLLIEFGDNAYQQTLLGAYELAKGYGRSLRLPVDNVLNNIVNLAYGAEAALTEEEENNGSH